jgi:flagellar biosynthesis protein FlhA
VAQIPSLIMSSAAGILVTRENKNEGVDKQFHDQMFSKDRVLIIAAVVMGMVGIVPGMPHFSFLTFAVVLGFSVWWRKRNPKQDLVTIEEEKQQSMAAGEETQAQKELSWDDVMPVDAIGLEVGYRLIPMVDRNQGGELMTRIKGIRKKLSQDLGFLIPPVHIRDNLDLAPNAYRLTLMGVSVAEAEIHPDRDMAINPGQVFGEIKGTAGKDPAFGLDAIWIDLADKEQAQTLGYTVVDANTVVATHLSKILQENAYELLGHAETQQLLDRLSATSAKLVEDLVPKLIPLSTVVKILQNLLSEGVPISDFRSIAECLAEHATQTQDANILTSVVRVALGRMIVQQINGLNNELPVITLEPALEQLLMQSTQMTEDSGGIEPGLAERLHSSLLESSQNQESLGQPAVLLVSAAVRQMLSLFTKHTIPQLNVLAYNEVPNTMQIKIVASVGQ